MSHDSGGASAIGKVLLAVWSELLDRPVSLDTNVIEAGANSIHLLLALNRLQETFGFELQAGDFFDHPVIRDLAEVCARLPAADDVEEFVL